MQNCIVGSLFVELVYFILSSVCFCDRMNYRLRTKPHYGSLRHRHKFRLTRFVDNISDCVRTTTSSGCDAFVSLAHTIEKAEVGDRLDLEGPYVGAPIGVWNLKSESIAVGAGDIQITISSRGSLTEQSSVVANYTLTFSLYTNLLFAYC